MTNEIVGTERIKEYVARLTAMIDGMKAAPAEQQNPILLFLLEALRERDQRCWTARRRGNPGSFPGTATSRKFLTPWGSWTTTRFRIFSSIWDPRRWPMLISSIR